jgi:hypothetical protein
VRGTRRLTFGDEVFPLAVAGGIAVVRGGPHVELSDLAGAAFDAFDASDQVATTAIGDEIVIAWSEPAAPRIRVRTYRCAGLSDPEAVSWDPLEQGRWTVVREPRNVAAAVGGDPRVQLADRATPPPPPEKIWFPDCKPHDPPRLSPLEVTLAEYRLCMRAGSCTPPAFEQDNPRAAVTGLTQAQARAYCAFAKSRLPTDEEWTLAASAECTRPTGILFNCIHSEAGYELKPPGSYKSDQVRGLYDLFGNAMEWTEDGTVRGSLYCEQGSLTMKDEALAGVRCMVP